MQIKTIIDLLSNETFRHFIGEHIKDDVNKLALEASKYNNIDIKAASILIALYQKAELKLPEHFKIMAALNAKSYEQCTCEAVAKYKAKIMTLENKKIINISGGIGIDDWAMAKYASQIVSCDTDEEIHKMAVYNIGLFNNIKIDRFLCDGIQFIKDNSPVDIIYADPDRRTTSNKKFKIEDCQPDILSNMPLLLSKANEVWIKLSPMADIAYIEKLFHSFHKLYVIAWLGEVKEILICCSNLKTEKIMKLAVNIGANKIETFKEPEADLLINMPKFNNTGKHLYEPNRAIIKIGLSAKYAQSLRLSMVAANSHLFISDTLIADFQGRKFEIMVQLAYKPRQIKNYLKTNGITKANITIRNFRETTDELKLRFNIKGGGSHYLFFTTDSVKKCWMYVCQPI